MTGKSHAPCTSASLLLLYLLISNNLSCSRAEKNPEVQISLGKIEGSMMKTRLGKDIYAFRGIRYAKPPTEERRFKVKNDTKSLFI